MGLIGKHRLMFGIKPSHTFITAQVMIALQFTLSLAATVDSANSVARSPSVGFNTFAACGICDPSKCPALHYCEGRAVKDLCQCCMVCSDDSFQPHISIATKKNGGDACEEVKCPNLKFCVENVQGLPLCECPGEHMCRKAKKREICGTDGMTYSSRCHMKIASCNHGVHIRKSYRGQCRPDDTPKDTAAYRKRLKKLKRKWLRKRRNRKHGGKGSGGRSEGKAKKKKEKREKRRRKRRKIGGKKSGGKKRNRSRRHRNKKMTLDKMAAWENNFGLATWN